MSEFKVTQAALMAGHDEFEGIRNKLNDCREEIKNVSNGLSFKISALTAMRMKLGVVSVNVGSCAKKSNAMAIGAQNIAETYDKYENDIANDRYPEQDSKGKIMLNDGILKNIEKLLSQVGITGAVGDLIFRALSGGYNGWDLKSILETVKSATGATKAVLGAVGTSDWAARLLGLNKKEVFKFAEGFGKEFDKFGDVSTGAKTGATVCQWAGALLSLGINGVDYYNEYKKGNVTGSEAVVSTGIKTGLDIAVGAAATAAAGAAIAALGFTAAPAVVIGAAGTGAVLIANWATELISGGKYSSFTGALTDGIVTVGEQAIGAAKSVVSGAVNDIKTAWKSVTRWFDRSPAYAGGGGGSW